MQLFAREWSLRKMGGDVDDCNAHAKPHNTSRLFHNVVFLFCWLEHSQTVLVVVAEQHRAFHARRLGTTSLLKSTNTQFVGIDLHPTTYTHSEAHFQASICSLLHLLFLSHLLHCITAIVHSTLFAMKVTHVASLFASGLGAIAVSSDGAISPSKLPPYPVRSAASATQSRHSLMASPRILSEPMFSPPPLSTRPLTSSSRSVPRTPPAVPQMP